MPSIYSESPRPTATCPICGEEILELNYRVPITEYGHCTLDRECPEAEDTEESDSMRYFCPECGEELNDTELSSIEEGMLTNTPTPTQEPETVIEPTSDMIEPGRYINIPHIICPRCKERIEIEGIETDKIKCHVCNKVLTIANQKTYP